ncbi:MAG: ATP-binding cassette domain-containing protein [Micromonosporaceae bacterium]|nr:ATP-binding cassette domain-containing protein [Micromonosporaceae bacterium]
MNALSIRGLVSGYAGSSVLHGVDLDVPADSVVAVLGRNGVGKTTLVSTVMGLVRRQAGSVRLGEAELSGWRPDAIARAGVALVPQGRRVFAPLTVAEHLTLAERLGGRRARGGSGGSRSARGGSDGTDDGRWTRARVIELLPRLGERLGHRGDQLSGGEQQMLAIARALLTNPRLLLLDEPSDGLAPAVVRQVGEVIAELAGEGIAILLVEQNLRLAFSVADRVAVMEKGRVVLDTDVADFRSDPARAQRLLGVS